MVFLIDSTMKNLYQIHITMCHIIFGHVLDTLWTRFGHVGHDLDTLWTPAPKFLDTVFFGHDLDTFWTRLAHGSIPTECHAPKKCRTHHFLRNAACTISNGEGKKNAVRQTTAIAAAGPSTYRIQALMCI